MIPNRNEPTSIFCSAQSQCDTALPQVAKRIYPTYREEYLYDERDRQKQVTQVLSEQLSYISRVDHDPEGNVISQLDAKLRASQRTYDSLNRLIQEVDSSVGETNYVYDVRDNLTRVIDAKGQTHTFTYDLINRKLTEARPMGQTIRYEYNANSELIERISPNGAKRKYFYDADHRLIEERHFLPSQTTASKTITYDYYADGRGLLKSFDDGLTKSVYEYDKKGQRTKETVTFGTGPTAIVKVIERTYELNGLLKTLTYPGSVGTQTYTYDANNQHASIKIPGLAANNDTLAYTYRWNAIETVTMPGNLKRTVTLDPLQRPTKIEVKGTGNLGIPVLNHRYEYDEMSNITKKTTLDGIYEYAYDEQDRLTDANPPDNLEAGVSGLPVESYQYDGVHNRMNSGHQPGQWIYNANNELNTWGIGDNKRVLTYDDNGSTTKEVLGEPASKTTDYIYDAQDRLIEVKNNAQTVARYAYDPMGRRVWRETFGADASTTWFLYSDEGLIGEYNQNGAAVREYGWNPGGLWGTDPVWQKDSSGVYLAHNDHLFTTDRLTKATDGRVAWTGVREAFGKTSVSANSQVTYLLRFPGQWEDSVGGFSQNWWREYLPSSSTYSQRDPIYRRYTNQFGYVEGNPISRFDNQGLFTLFIPKTRTDYYLLANYLDTKNNGADVTVPSKFCKDYLGTQELGIRHERWFSELKEQHDDQAKKCKSRGFWTYSPDAANIGSQNVTFGMGFDKFEAICITIVSECCCAKTLCTHSTSRRDRFVNAHDIEREGGNQETKRADVLGRPFTFEIKCAGNKVFQSCSN